MRRVDSFSQENLATWLDLAQEAVRAAGEVLLHTEGHGGMSGNTLPRDIKVSADWEAEERIVQTLRQNSVFPIVTEERGVVEGTSRHRQRQWIVDPLDGSFNYWRGIPFYCVSVALWNGQRPLLGAVYDVTRQDLFTGVARTGAWLNGHPIHVSTIITEDQAVLCTGFPAETDFSSEALAGHIQQIQRYKKLRWLGSAALSLCYVAAGRVDAYMERDIKLWDVAAGLAIVCGAGGRFVRAPSVTPQAMTVYADNACLPTPCL